MNKPVVHYTEALHVRPGQCAVVFGVTDHPNHLEGHDVANDPDRMVRTSTVLSFDQETGRFETKNTIYERKQA